MCTSKHTYTHTAGSLCSSALCKSVMLHFMRSDFLIFAKCLWVHTNFAQPDYAHIAMRACECVCIIFRPAFAVFSCKSSLIFPTLFDFTPNDSPFITSQSTTRPTSITPISYLLTHYALPLRLCAYTRTIWDLWWVGTVSQYIYQLLPIAMPHVSRV